MQLAQDLENMFTGAVIEIAGWFVRKQQLRAGNKCPRDSHSLLLPAGNLADLMAEAMAKAYSFQNLPGCNFRFPAIVAPDKLGHHRVLNGRKFGEKVMELKHESDVPIPEAGQLLRTPPENVFIPQENFASRGIVQAAHKMQQRALSRSRWSDYRHELSLFDGQVQVLEDDNVRRGSFVDLRQIPRFNHSRSSLIT
jgi:hypothetical protein